jgi:DNA-binding NarL/FixJ family response regulator
VSRIRVLIAEDETSTRKLLQFRLSHEPDLEVIAEAGDGREALDLAFRLRPDVAVLDLNLPGLNGIQITERIRTQQPLTQVILFTALDDLASLGRSSGAFACLGKQRDPEELVRTIREAFRARAEGNSHPAESTSKVGERLTVLAARARLSERERMVVEKAVDTTLTVQQIAHALAQELGEEVTHASVKHSLDRAMAKLQIEPRTRAGLVRHVLEYDPSDTAAD